MNDVKAINAILDRPERAVLAVIVAVDGPSYRPVGAMMAIFGANDRVGSLSSGCVEGDIALHAQDALGSGNPIVVKYGKGSQFLDIQLPCGGGLEIILVPNPDLDVLSQVAWHHQQRQSCTLGIDIESGAMSVRLRGHTERTGSNLNVEIIPDIYFWVFGKGPEAAIFISLARSAGYPAALFSPDDETISVAQNSKCKTNKLTSKFLPDDICIDKRSAVILFFHDHDWEPQLLSDALQTPAFYIGAQGGLNARETRYAAMKKMGATLQQIERLHGPVGLIPSAKDPTTLAVSVLAEIVGKAAANT